MGHAVRFATDANPEATVLGVGAIRPRAQKCNDQVVEVPCLQGLLPFVRSTNLQPSCYKWVDSEGVRHDIQQHEGGEQGDPLMPLLFSLVIHDALAEVKETLEPGQPLGRDTPGSGWDPTPRRKEDVEQRWSTASQNGRSRSRCVESRWHQNLGHPNGQ